MGLTVKNMCFLLEGHIFNFEGGRICTCLEVVICGYLYDTCKVPTNLIIACGLDCGMNYISWGILMPDFFLYNLSGPND
jgi:hypothetical protein